jgi:hypothetical protein
MLSDGKTAVASDPDRDVVYVADTVAKTLSWTIGLSAGDEPGRLVADGAGRVHVALRSGGALVTVDPIAGTVLERRSVCPAPRGVAWDSTTDLVWVACATGELVALPAAGGATVTRWVVERDLRDVFAQAGSITVTKFRTAEVLRLAADGTVLRRDAMPPAGAFAPHVAWRSVMQPSGRTVTLHQEHSQTSVPTQARSSYGSNAGGIVSPRCTVLDATGALVSTFPLDEALAFDVAASPDGSSVAVVGAGLTGSSIPVVEVVAMDGSARTSIASSQWGGAGQATAVSFDGSGDVIVQTREPAALWVLPVSSGVILPTDSVLPSTGRVALSALSRDDAGHDLFHTPTSAQIACASCHPEGGDDGHVWILDGQQRRSPSLRGTIAGTAPYHWTGDEMDFPTLVDDVFTNRMAGPTLTTTQMGALTQWVQSIPAPPSPSWVDAASAARGSALFADTKVGCAMCHTGPKFTNNQTTDVGTGQAFQVPPLIGVGWRLPLLHDGCAQTIADRFGACATAAHGLTSALLPQDVADLTAYLDTL